MSKLDLLSSKEDPIYLMDANAFIFRAFFANTKMSRSDLFPTGAIYSVSRLVLKIIKEENPKYFAFVIDGKGKNFRHEIYPEYKSQRPQTPEDLLKQLDPIKNFIKSLGIRIEISDNCEADDCIASLAKKFSKERPVIIIGTDKDLKQCLNENVLMWDPGSKNEKIVTEKSFYEDTGLNPSQWPDVQALIGDSSDNIPGVKGIGEKTAIKIFENFKNLEDIRDRFALLSLPVKKKMEGNLEAMFLYRQLTTLDINQCSDLDLNNFRIEKANKQNVLTFLNSYELKSLIKDFNTLVSKKIILTVEGYDSQGSLFSETKEEKKNEKDDDFIEIIYVKHVEELPSFKNKVVGLIPYTSQNLDHGFSISAIDLPKSLDFLKDKAFPNLNLLENSPKTVPQKPNNKQNIQLPRQSLLSLISPNEKIEPKNSLVSELIKPNANASTSTEYYYTGDFSALINHLQNASQIVVHNLKDLLHKYPILGFMYNHFSHFFDLGIAAWLLSPDEKDYGFSSISAKHAFQNQISLDYPAKLALSLYLDNLEKLESHNLLKLMFDLEMPLIPVLYEMEKEGIQVNLAELHNFLEEVQVKIEEYTKLIYQEAGEDFNIRSAQQLGEILFKKLQLPTSKSTKGGQASTSQEVLEKLIGSHPIIDTLQEYRKLEKLRSTYLEPLPKQTSSDGRIRTTFNQAGTATGRLSSSNPNLQNIPVRGEFGKRMRSCFTAKEGHLLVSADYSQVELRVLAHFSKDKTLEEAFKNNEDIHTRTAALLYDISLDSVNSDMRRHAKTINFGLLYGMGVRKLAQDLHISQQEAKNFMEIYFARFDQVKNFYEEVEEFARKNAYVITLAGRQRKLDDILSQDHRAKALAERQAVNTLIQGSAADIIKLAMLKIYNSQELKNYEAKLLLQIHDELILEVPEKYAEQAGQKMAELMSNIEPMGKKLLVPLVVDYGIGKNWGEAH